VPTSQAAALVTNGFRVQLLQLRDTTGLAIAGLLDSIDLDLPPSALATALASWVRRAQVLVGSSQEQGGVMALQYLLAYLQTSGVDPAIEDVEPVVPRADPLTVVQGALFYRLGQSSGRGAAVTSAAAVAQRVARSAVQSAATSTIGLGMDRSPTVSGWRRATSSSCCARCAAAAAKGVHDAGDSFRAVHPADRCTQEPVVAGITERVLRAAPQVVSP
jgi:hypothetical protein